MTVVNLIACNHQAKWMRNDFLQRSKFLAVTSFFSGKASLHCLLTSLPSFPVTESKQRVGLHTSVVPYFRSVSRYYNRESIVSDVDYAPLLTSLLIGPCALEYTKVKSCYGQAW